MININIRGPSDTAEVMEITVNNVITILQEDIELTNNNGQSNSDNDIKVLQ